MPELDVSPAYRESFVCWSSDQTEDYPFDHDHKNIGAQCDWGWVCSGCPNRVDERPCPDHAPTTVPGLRLVECQAEPRHWLFAHDRDDMGHGCPWCWYDRAKAELDPLKQADERREHLPCVVWNPLKRFAVWARVARVTCYSHTHACDHIDIKWRWA